MLIPRIIPCLLLQDGGLVKTTKFKHPKYIGDPINAVKIFNDKEVDELIFLDIEASKFKKEPEYTVIQEIAQEAFMPFSYGGGIASLKQIERILSVGVEKVIVNNKALHSYGFIEEAAKEFGSSSIIVAIDIKKDFFGVHKVFDHTVGKSISKNLLDHVMSCESSGAGELFLNLVDRDGTFLGYDTELLSRVAVSVSIPVIGCGGAKSVEEMTGLVNDSEVSSASAGSIFVFQGPHRAVLISYPSRQKLEYLFSSNSNGANNL